MLFALLSGQRPQFDPNKYKCGDDIILLVEEMWSEAPDNRSTMKDAVGRLGLRTGDQFGQAAEMEVQAIASRGAVPA